MGARSASSSVHSPSLPAHRLTWAGLTPDENNTASRVSYATGDSSALAALIRKRLL
jgi:hypothetical protein